MRLTGVIFLFLTGWENMQYNQRRKSAWIWIGVNPLQALIMNH